MKVWGLTGGIASGKSLAAKFFAEAGAPVLDADQVARELSAPGGAAHDAILARFGTTDRAKLRSLVFGDAAARRDLEAILHPLIRAESLRRMQKLEELQLAARAPRFPVIYEAALLVETGRYKDFEGLIVVDAPREQRLARLCQRDRCDVAAAEAILAAQLGDSERRAAATHLLDNSGPPEALREKVLALLKRLQETRSP